jgi:hypothetical protein
MTGTTGAIGATAAGIVCAGVVFNNLAEFAK